MLGPDLGAVVFDVVGTLIHAEPSAAQVYAAVGRRFGSRLTAEDIRPRFVAAFASQEALDLAGDLRTSEDREHRRWRQIVAEVLDDVPDSNACFQELHQHFASSEAWSCDAAAARTLKELSHRGLVLGLASNYDHRLRSVLAGLPALEPLEYVIISSEVGWRKPSSDFFAAVCRVVGLPPKHILFVGDDRRNDYDGARAAGLQAVLLDPGSEVPVAQQTITSLIDLLQETSLRRRQ
jgi:putative hydrolase of the HAD superfamily